MSDLGFQFEYDSGCLIVRASGRAIVEQKEAWIKAIAQAVSAQPVKALLLDIRDTTVAFTFMDRFQIGELTARHLSEIPLAVLGLSEQVDRQYLAKLVAVNRGARMEMFVDEAAAYAWIKKHAISSTEG